MVQKCKNCGEPVFKFPVKGQPSKTMGENMQEGTMIWKNLFKIDWFSLLFVIVILFMVLGYKADIAKCQDVMENPNTYCGEYCKDTQFRELLKDLEKSNTPEFDFNIGGENETRS